MNYKTEETCAAAMARFHDSTFHGVRLVCRLRRTPAAASPGVPTGPAALSPATPPRQAPVEAAVKADEESAQESQLVEETENSTKVNDKYFIVKSLTVEDLELSARNGIWATQAHNEEALNKAFGVSLACVATTAQSNFPPVCRKRLFGVLCKQVWRIFWIRANGFSY